MNSYAAQVPRLLQMLLSEVQDYGRLSSRGQRLVEDEASVVRCMCGYQIFCEVGREGECLGSLPLFDDEPASSTRSKRFKNRPGCGQRLGLISPKYRLT